MASWSTGALPDEAAPRAPERYARGGELGRGGMGVVEAAHDAWLDRDVAIKRLISGTGSVARLAREARLTARLVHPAIPPVYDVGEDADGSWYSMPVLRGRTLSAALAERRGGPRVWLDAVAAACRAVGYAHRHGVVHRDLKPENLLLGDAGELWVIDWGLALDPAEPDGAVVGTPGFQAPEQAAGAASPASDVFALGRTLAEVLAAMPGEDPELGAIVRRATAADPAARYPDANALADELDRWRDGRLVLAHRYPLREVFARLIRRWRAPLWVAVAAGVVGAVGAVSAWRAQAAERARADQSHGRALALQASALVPEGARPEAEVLAVAALRLGESATARGVLMAWGGRARPTRLADATLPCERPFLEQNGAMLCVGERLRWRPAGGGAGWDAPFERRSAGGDDWRGEVVEARAFADGSALLRRSSNHVELWRAGLRVAELGPFHGFFALADGPVAAVIDGQRVGRVDPATGAIAWGEPACAQAEAAWAGEGAVVLGCREPRVFVGDWASLGAGEALPGSPSVVGWAGGPIVGTFDGQLLVRSEAGWAATPSPVGAPRALLDLGDGRVAVWGERRETVIFAPATSAFVGELPRGALGLAAREGAVWAMHEALRGWRLGGDAPARLDRAAEGGISSFDLDPDGRWVGAGSASGEVVVWALASGEARVRAGPGGETPKAVVWLGPERLAWSWPSHGLVATGPEGPPGFTPLGPFAREAVRWGDGLALLPWASRVDLFVDGEARPLPLPTRALAATVADGALWVVDEAGAAYELVGDRFEARFVLDEPAGALAASGDLLLLAVGDRVEARAHDGRLVWSWRAAAPLTTLAATERWIAAGDAEGQLVVLTPAGAVQARAAAHARRVSGLVFRRGRLFSAGWDGAVRVWGLDELTTPPAALQARLDAAWGLDVEAALAAAGPR